ncbi:MAG: hypothetical protein J7J14_08085 [Thermotogaceae bacterium]|nr:hypothetical protein [Thermotogaceae bacterium]
MTLEEIMEEILEMFEENQDEELMDFFKKVVETLKMKGYTMEQIVSGIDLFLEALSDVFSPLISFSFEDYDPRIRVFTEEENLNVEEKEKLLRGEIDEWEFEVKRWS